LAPLVTKKNPAKGASTLSSKIPNGKDRKNSK